MFAPCRIFVISIATALPLLAIAPSTRAQMGPAPGLSSSSLNHPYGPAELDGNGNASALNVIPLGGTVSRTLAAASADRLNLKSYGAAGTAQSTLLTVSIAAGSTALTTATGVFAATDVGKIIDVPGAGASGAILTGAVISFYISPTAVTLSVPALTALTASSQTLTWGFDDGLALAAAEAQVNANATAGVRTCIYVPGGKYLIKTRPPGFAEFVPGCITGDGQMHSFLIADAGFTGDMLSWSEAWGLANLFTGTYATSGWNGPKVEGLSLVAISNAPGLQNAIMFYDRNDFAFINNVDVYYFNGAGLSIGTVKNQPEAYMRESKFNNLRVWGAGNATTPAVLIGSANTTGGSSDSTNELSFYGLDIISSNGIGLKISNTNPLNATRLIRFFGARVEGALNDLIQIGDPLTSGAISTVLFDGLEENAVPSGFCGIRLGGTLASSPNGTRVQGLIGSGAGKALCIQSGANSAFNLTGIGASGTGVTIAASTLVAGPIYLDGNGQEAAWTTSIDATVLPLVRLPAQRYGTPNGNSSMAANYHDGGPNGGNPLPIGSVDLQSTRFSATQIASGINATITGGADNTASGSGSFVGGGSQNSGNSFNGVVGGGNANVAGGGSFETISGGQANTVLGAYSTIPGGQNAVDRSRYGWIGWSSGKIVTSGDAQTGEQFMHGVTAAATGLRLTADLATANANDTANITASTHYHTRVSASCRDNTGAGWASWDALPGDLDRGTGTTVTYVGAYSTATAPTRSSGTLATMTLILAADSTNAGLSVTASPPSGNTDTIHCGSLVQTTEEMQ